MWGGEKKKLDLGKYSVMIYEYRGKKFEIIVDPRKVLDFRENRAEPEEAVLTFDVFMDAQKGVRASEEDVKKIIVRCMIRELREKGKEVDESTIREIEEKLEEYDENKLREIASIYILKYGTLKLPKYLRDELLEKKERQIVSYLQKYAINPSTKAPYPPEVLNDAIKKLLSGEKVGDSKARIIIDPLRDVEEQLPQIIEALKMVLPIRLEVVSVRVKIPPQYVGQAYSKIESFGKIKESSWGEDGSLEALVEVPAGQFVKFNRELNNITRGNFKMNIVERKIIG